MILSILSGRHHIGKLVVPTVQPDRLKESMAYAERVVLHCHRLAVAADQLLASGASLRSSVAKGRHKRSRLGEEDFAFGIVYLMLQGYKYMDRTVVPKFWFVSQNWPKQMSIFADLGLQKTAITTTNTYIQYYCNLLYDNGKGELLQFNQ
jgi:hypothetical protein